MALYGDPYGGRGGGGRRLPRMRRQPMFGQPHPLAPIPAQPDQRPVADVLAPHVIGQQVDLGGRHSAYGDPNNSQFQADLAAQQAALAARAAGQAPARSDIASDLARMSVQSHLAQAGSDQNPAGAVAPPQPVPASPMPFDHRQIGPALASLARRQKKPMMGYRHPLGGGPAF